MPGYRHVNLSGGHGKSPEFVVRVDEEHAEYIRMRASEMGVSYSAFLFEVVARDRKAWTEFQRRR